MAKLVAEGRKKEFAAFGWDASQIPNPEDMETFTDSKLKWEEADEGLHQDMFEWTARLIHIRRNSISLNDGDRGHIKVTFDEDNRWLRMDRNLVSVFANLGSGPCLFKVGAEYELLLASVGEYTHVEDGHLTLPPDGFAIVSAEKQ
jgi:maltooligosyltrehalose trehalohydrolase